MNFASVSKKCNLRLRNLLNAYKDYFFDIQFDDIIYNEKLIDRLEYSKSVYR